MHLMTDVNVNVECSPQLTHTYHGFSNQMHSFCNAFNMKYNAFKPNCNVNANAMHLILNVMRMKMK